MKKLTAVLLVFVFTLSACGVTLPGAVTGSGKMIKESLNVHGFDQIHIGTSGVMYIEQGDDFSLSVEADDNILPLLDITVDKGVLTLRTTPKVSTLQFETIIYRVTLPALSSLAISGSADVRVEDFTADSISINVNGSGDVTFVNLQVMSLSARISGSGNLILPNLSAQNVFAEVNNSGQMEMAGVTGSLIVKTSGSGDLLAEKLTANTVQVAVNGSGDATVWAVDTLDVTINGSGGVRYFGSPKLTEKISGGGALTALGSR